MEQKRIILAYSGGIRSTVAMYHYINRGYIVTVVAFLEDGTFESNDVSTIDDASLLLSEGIAVDVASSDKFIQKITDSFVFDLIELSEEMDVLEVAICGFTDTGMLQKVKKLVNSGRIVGWQPFFYFIYDSIDKSMVLREGLKFNVPLHLTRSCEKTTKHHCGICDKCVARKNSFMDAGIPDVTVYCDNNGGGVC